MKKLKKYLLIPSIALLAATGCYMTGCEKKDSVSSQIKNNAITIENNNVRIVIDENNGFIKELCNKEKGLFLVKDINDATAIRLAVCSDSLSSIEKTIPSNDFTYQLINNDHSIDLICRFSFSNGVEASTKISVEEGNNEISFKIDNLTGLNPNKPTYSVEYPVFDGIDTLDKYETDYLLSPFAMGYLFHNPIETFAHSENLDEKGINKEHGYYPSGINTSMQFFSYFSKDKGGFLVQTKDPIGESKSFTFTENDNKLRASIWHYLTDIGVQTFSFDYDIVCSNLVQGNWYEPAEKYKQWAEEQTWCKDKGKNAYRNDLNKDLYDKTVLCNFVEPSRNFQNGCTEIYQKIRNNIDSKILVIPYYWSVIPTPTLNDSTALYSYKRSDSSSAFYDAVKSNDDLIAYFEYINCGLSTIIPKGFENNVMLDQGGNEKTAVFGSTKFYLECATEEWNELVYNREMVLVEQLEADGYYNDIGIGAAVPLLCYNTAHKHGTKVSVREEFLDQLKNVYDISRQYGGFTGQEMLSEIMIPYVDIYQCRANAGEMGGMENDPIMKYVEEGTAEKVPLFEYIYSEYCGIRLDGFTLPLESVGVPYYYATAFTALNGGFPEYNWEWTGDNSYPKADKYSDEMIQFVQEIGNPRTSYGKKYIVYGQMARNPSLNLDKIDYPYSTPINNGDGSWANYDQQGNKSGNMLCDPVVCSAYKKDGKVAIFLCNITENPINLNFDIDAANLYGINDGEINLLLNNQTTKIGSLKKGKYNFNRQLPSRKVAMITIG